MNTEIKMKELWRKFKTRLVIIAKTYQNHCLWSLKQNYEFKTIICHLSMVYHLHNFFW